MEGNLVHQDTTLRVQNTSPTVEDALALASHGLEILPCAPGTKQPARGLEHWQGRSTTASQTITDWWAQYPDANIGYVVGPQRIVLDIDPRNGGLESWQALLARHGTLPPTWKAWSGRQDDGQHFHFTVPFDVTDPNAIDLGPGVQVFGLGHLVVLPPSLHPVTGQPYRWDACNPLTLWAPAAAPTWLVNEMRWATAIHHDQSKQSAQKNSHKASDLSLSFQPSTKVPEDLNPPLGTLVESPAQANTPKKGHGDYLLTLACDPKHLPALLGACGLPVTLEVGDSCLCPFHDDHTPSAWLRGPTETHRTYALYCFACQKYFALVDVYKHRRSANLLALHTEIDGKGQRLDHHTLRLMWTTRLLEEATILTLHELGCPSLPPDAPQGMRDLWSIFLHVRRIRSATREANAPFPFSWRFVLDWAGGVLDWTQHQVQKLKCFGIGRGLWHAAGKDSGGNTLWGIGRKALRKARKATPTFRTEKAALADVATTVVPEPTQSVSCPDAYEFGHQSRECLLCIQARLLELRARAGIVVDEHDPYGRGVAWQPS
jgi:Bifunctional DNA primase/polymerase, N-terminal